MARSLLVLTLALGLLPASASAAPAHDLRGTWSCVNTSGGTCTFDITSMNMSTGRFSGSGAGNGYTWPVTGKLEGSSLTMKHGPYNEFQSYTANYTGKVSADGNKMSGNYDDGRGPVRFEYQRVPGGGGGGGGDDDDDNGKRPTGMQVICNYVVATSQNTCFATVGDAGPAPAVTPTGTVKFKSNNGGTFPFGDTCVLKASESAPTAPSCSADYIAPSGSGFPKVTATYLGSTEHASSTASTRFLVPGGPINYNTPTSPSGKYPNQIGLRTNVPTDDAIVEACVVAAKQGGTKKASLSQEKLESLTEELKGYRKQLGRPGLSVPEIERLQRHIEMTVAEAAFDIEFANAQIEILREKKERTVEETERLREMVEKRRDMFDELGRIIDEYNVCGKGTIRDMKPRRASVAATRSTRLGFVRRRNVDGGPLRLKLRLNRKQIARLAGKRKTLKAYVRVTMLLPSGLSKSGWPTSTIEPIVLKRRR